MTLTLLYIVIPYNESPSKSKRINTQLEAQKRQVAKDPLRSDDGPLHDILDSSVDSNDSDPKPKNNGKSQRSQHKSPPKTTAKKYNLDMDPKPRKMKNSKS